MSWEFFFQEVSRPKKIIKKPRKPGEIRITKEIFFSASILSFIGCFIPLVKGILLNTLISHLNFPFRILIQFARRVVNLFIYVIHVTAKLKLEPRIYYKKSANLNFRNQGTNHGGLKI